MQLQTKALYNLIRLNTLDDQHLECEPWQKEDLRTFSDEQLFSKLKLLGLSIDVDNFHRFSDVCDTPEELTECLVTDSENDVLHDQLYLIIFELWRRFYHEKQSLSIFCDELDHRIFLYDKKELENDELIQDALASLEEILDENVDEGEDPKKVFENFCQYCAHDIPDFLYDYIFQQIESENELYAKELLEGFYPYVKDGTWFDFLQIMLNPENLTELDALISHLKKEPNLDLQFQILDFLSGNQAPSLFIKLIKQTLPLIKTEQDYQDLLKLTLEYYSRLDEEDKEKKVAKLLKGRSSKKVDDEIDSKEIKSFSAIIS